MNVTSSCNTDHVTDKICVKHPDQLRIFHLLNTKQAPFHATYLVTVLPNVKSQNTDTIKLYPSSASESANF